MSTLAEKIKTDEELKIRPEDKPQNKSSDSDSGDGEKRAEKKDDGHQEPVDQANIDALAPVQELYDRQKADEKSAQDSPQQEVSQPQKSSDGVEVLDAGDGRYLIQGITSFAKEDLTRVLSKHGINIDITFPGDWDTRTEKSQRDWLRREHDITVVRPVSGAAVTDFLGGLPDEATVSADLGNYIREIRRISEGDRSYPDKTRVLQNIETQLRNAKVGGDLTANQALIEQVQDVLSEGINNFGNEAIREDNERIERGRGAKFEQDKDHEIPTKNATNELLKLAAAGTVTGVDWDNARQELYDKIDEVEALVTAAEPANYKQAYFTAKGLREAIESKMDAFDALPADVKTKLTNIYQGKESFLSRLDQKFQSKLNKMSRDLQHSRIGDIDTDAAIYLKQISSGFGASIGEAKNRLIDKIPEDPDGIRAWRVYKSIDSLDEAIRVQQLTETPVIWQEVPQKLASVYTQMESMDFTVEELQVVTNQAIQLVRSVTPDNPEGRQMRDKLVDELEAFRGFHSMRITMERNDMDPERMLEIFQTYFKDDTWQHFAERFSKDSKDRKFLAPKKDEHGNYLDKDGNVVANAGQAERKELNVFDIAFSQYSEKLRQERIKMNMVEEITKHAIQNPFDAGTIREIEKGMRITLSAEQRADLENIRQYFVSKTQEVIDNKTSNIDPTTGVEGLWHDKQGRIRVDDVWARKGKINNVELLKNFGAVTHELVQEWSGKQTLQGAFGNVGKNDLADLGEEFRDEVLGILREQGNATPTDDEFKAAVEAEYLGKNFLHIRRGQMLKALAQEIEDKEVEVNLEGGNREKVDLDYLRQSGFLDSVDSNAYYTTWMFEWSNYDGIRIYSRDTKGNLDDDFESYVFHQATNLFYGRHVDHIWEFYHDTNENRGRPKDNDVNRIWKQNLPGKHHYLFPQNSLMARWAENFMNEEQKATLKRRTGEMMKQWDFDNEKYHDEYAGWMRNAALMDMVESGEVSMSAVDNNTTFSEVMREGKVRKFEMIDAFVDRNKHKKYAGPEGLQAYLANPTEGKFIEINDKTKTFYSSRAARQFPYMTLATRAHWNVASKHRRRLFDQPNLTSAGGENMVETLAGRGDMERKQAEHEKRKMFGFKEVAIGGDMFTPKVAGFEAPGPLGALVGTVPFRRVRQTLEFGRKSAWEAKHVPLVLPLFGLFGFIWGGFTEFIKQGIGQAAGGRR